jgi:hypothetical protein
MHYQILRDPCSGLTVCAAGTRFRTSLTKTSINRVMKWDVLAAKTLVSSGVLTRGTPNHRVVPTHVRAASPHQLSLIGGACRRLSRVHSASAATYLRGSHPYPSSATCW